MEQKTYLNLKEIMRETGLSASTIHRRIKENKSPWDSVVHCGRRLLFPSSILEDLKRSEDNRHKAGKPENSLPEMKITYKVMKK